VDWLLVTVTKVVRFVTWRKEVGWLVGVRVVVVMFNRAFVQRSREISVALYLLIAFGWGTFIA
jgi:hypothetical protein